jgi:beta-lactam-binding protein with PASTA domain
VPSAPAKSPPGTPIILDVEEGGIEIPSFIGKNVRNALETAEAAGLDLDAIGHGTAREQSPQPGTRVPAGSHVVVRFVR